MLSRGIKTFHRRVFSAATFEGLRFVSFQSNEVKKTCIILWPVRVFFSFLKKRGPNECCLCEANEFYLYIFSRMRQDVNLLQKKSV